MTEIETQLHQAAKNNDGCALQSALDSVPFNQHLKMLRDLQQSASDSVDVKIKDGSSALNFEADIYTKKPPAAMQLPADKLEEMAKIMNLPAEQLKGMVGSATKADPLLYHERFFQTGGDNKSSQRCRTLK